MNGYTDGTFRPEAQITRAEMAVMIARALRATIDASHATGFADDGDIPFWAKGAVEAMHRAGTINGQEGNRFAPNETATRAEAVVIITRMLE